MACPGLSCSSGPGRPPPTNLTRAEDLRNAFPSLEHHTGLAAGGPWPGTAVQPSFRAGVAGPWKQVDVLWKQAHLAWKLGSAACKQSDSVRDLTPCEAQGPHLGKEL